MLTDAMLREATAEAERFLLSTMPEDGEPHEFSKRFLRKMEKLIRRTNHPIRYQIMRTAAAVALAIVTLFGAVMAVSPEARAAVVSWIKSSFHEFFEYSNANPGANTSSDDADEVPQYEYRLSVAPEGYREWKIAEKVDGKTYIYINDKEEILKFAYSYGAKIDRLFIKSDEYEQYSATINGVSADIYIAAEEQETSVIVWEDPQEDTLIRIFAIADKETLVKIAETVVKTGQ